MSIFEGVTGILSGVLGELVTYHPQVGPPQDLESLFREAPIEVEGADGQIVRIEAPSWRVPRHLVPGLRRGDRITVPGGRLYKVTLVHPTGSPAPDAFSVCELQLVTGP